MTRYIAIRIGQGLLVLLGAVTISFVLVNIAGDPISSLGVYFISPQAKQKLIHLHGYDKPMVERFLAYLTSVLRGDFGTSFRQPVGALTLVMRALPSTIYLVLGAVFVTVAVSVPAALYAVLRRGSFVDRATRSTLMLAQGLPAFWLGVILVLIFSVQLRWLPSFGDNGLTSYILPIAALSIPLFSTVVRLLRSQLLDIMGMEFVTALRAKGLSERDIVLRHALHNAMPPLVTFMALQIGWLFGGTIIVEAVFAWPGIGTLAIIATQNADMTVIQALVVVVAAVYVLLNLIADVLVLAIDPRLRVQA
jgi:peptide/nickel transport system permease protein